MSNTINVAIPPPPLPPNPDVEMADLELRQDSSETEDIDMPEEFCRSGLVRKMLERKARREKIVQL